ncbi:Srsf3 [Symbiodinium pilosum]|uniref:Srsf3 protein n=1 Tax=Symbiodinium pilosum TaxID=2952 RepID=A0A812MZ03_SYMPI|nr:Srsf3 [Symbiodinium pilosum]
MVQNYRSRKALNEIAYGSGPRFSGNAPQKNMMGAPAKVPGVDFAVPSELDPSNANVMHMVKPRSSEVAILMAEHARWAQREALKALYLASADSNQAFEAARRANVAAMEALRQPSASFPTYAERPLPGEPWLSAARWPTDPPDPLRTMPRGSSPPGVHLERLAEWFWPQLATAKLAEHGLELQQQGWGRQHCDQDDFLCLRFRLHPRPPAAQPVPRLHTEPWG